MISALKISILVIIVAFASTELIYNLDKIDSKIKKLFGLLNILGINLRSVTQ